MWSPGLHVLGASDGSDGPQDRPVVQVILEEPENV
jgi:hypothetical protein